MVKLVAMLKNSADASPDLDVRLKVEESRRELESYMTRAEQLLGQRESQSGLISKYKVGLSTIKCRLFIISYLSHLKLGYFHHCYATQSCYNFNEFPSFIFCSQKLLKT